jgi:hypothetical protein
MVVIDGRRNVEDIILKKIILGEQGEDNVL